VGSWFADSGTWCVGVGAGCDDRGFVGEGRCVVFTRLLISVAGGWREGSSLAVGFYGVFGCFARGW
jgi:hypothetical protein